MNVTSYLLLVPVFVLCLAGSGLSYSDSLRRGPYYVPAMVLLGAACACLFAWGAWLLDDAGKVFVYSLAYDVVVLACYYLFPLLVMGVRVPPGVLVGAALVVAGLVVVKTAGG